MGKTFREFDKFGLEEFADKLTKYLQVESKCYEDSYVLSLNSEFGSGKSTFFEMWAERLRQSNDTFEVVSINAWESDFHGDPLLAIVSSLTKDVKTSKDVKTLKDIKQLKETAGKLGKFTLSIGNDIVNKVTGVDLIKAGGYAEPGKDKPENLGSECFKLYQDKQKLFENLKFQLRSFVQKTKLPILIIVDELDRCRPNYAIEFLETIKHFFDIKGLVFVLGVDKSQLESSAKAMFGSGLNFDEYYRKFAQRNISLPVKSEGIVKLFSRNLIDEYFSEEVYKERGLWSYAQYEPNRINDISNLCVVFNLNARQIHECFRISAHTLSGVSKREAYMLWGWQMATFFMVCLSIKEETFYNRIGNRDISLKDFTASIKDLMFSANMDKSCSRWAQLIYIGAFTNQPWADFESEFEQIGAGNVSNNPGINFESKLDSFSKSVYGSSVMDYGRKTIFSEIYEILEGVRTFEE